MKKVVRWGIEIISTLIQYESIPVEGKGVMATQVTVLIKLLGAHSTQKHVVLLHTVLHRSEIEINWVATGKIKFSSGKRKNYNILCGHALFIFIVISIIITSESNIFLV